MSDFDGKTSGAHRQFALMLQVADDGEEELQAALGAAFSGALLANQDNGQAKHAPRR